MKDEKRKKKFQFLRLTLDGKGISKSKAEVGYGFKGFFLSYKDNFNKILYCNIFMILGNFPILFLIAALSGVSKLDSYLPMYDVFQNLASFFTNEPATPFSMTLYALEGLQNQTLVPTVGTYILYGLGGLTLLTFGCVNAGTAYILRNIAMGEPVFTWSDFWYAVKRNWKQALPFGIIDILLNAILIFNIYSMVTASDGFFTDLFFWANVVIFIVYFIMRYYIYIQMVTFKLTVFKIIKNSFIFVLVGIKRNIVALLGIILCLLLELAFLLGAGGILQPLAVAFPLAILFSSLSYMKVYAAYYKIKVVMIDPYKAEHPDPEPEYDDGVIMADDVTARERLEEVKRRNGIRDEDD